MLVKLTKCSTIGSHPTLLPRHPRPIVSLCFSHKKSLSFSKTHLVPNISKPVSQLSSAISSGQLTFTTWHESYLVCNAFPNPSRPILSLHVILHFCMSRVNTVISSSQDGFSQQTVFQGLGLCFLVPLQSSSTQHNAWHTVRPRQLLMEQVIFYCVIV